MMIHELKKSKGRIDKSKRVGRGDGSGKGNYSGRGMKGQKARSGGNIPAHFEGGQTPLHRRLPKLRGFKRYYKLLKYYEPVNIGQLEADEKIESNEQVTKALLAQHGYLRKPTSAVKLLGRGELTKKLHFVDIDAVSASALTKIEQAGGSVSQVLGSSAAVQQQQ